MTPVPKPRPRALEKADRIRDLAAEERRQRAECKRRSGGVCEVFWRHEGAVVPPVRCHRRAVHNHHLLGGIGQRNVGRSILAAHRIDTCEECHRAIHAHVLVPAGPNREYADHVVYERKA